MSDLFDVGGLFGEFFGHGAVPPESVARKVLGIGADVALSKEAIAATFRFRVKLLRPDLSDAGADALKVRDLTDEERPILEGGAGLRFDSGSREEQLAELMWAREFLVGRIPRPVTGAEGGVTMSRPSPEDVTRREREREERERAKREHERRLHREHNREYRRRRAEREPTRLICRECREPIGHDELAIVGNEWASKDEFVLNPYVEPRGWYRQGYYHERCLPDKPVRPVAWLEKDIAGGYALEAECDVCGRLVKPPRWLARRGGGRVYYCSPGCAGGADRIARTVVLEDAECESCGELFAPARSDAVYCSPACRQRAYRSRLAEAAGPPRAILGLDNGRGGSKATADHSGRPAWPRGRRGVAEGGGRP